MKDTQVRAIDDALMDNLRHIIQQEARKINLIKFPRVRFAIEFNFDPDTGQLVDSGVEVRYRRDLRK